MKNKAETETVQLIQMLSRTTRHIDKETNQSLTSNRRSRYLRNNGQRNNKNREETSSNSTEAVESRYPEVNEQVKAQ